MRLTPANLSSIVQEDLPSVTSIDVSNKEISHIDDISICVNLHKLNLTNNALDHQDNLSGIKYCKEMTWLNLQQNQFDEGVFEALEGLKKLLVLNVSHNQLNRMPLALSRITSLKALILSHNSISRVDNIQTLVDLNTLVVSHNPIAELTGIGALANLNKLSASHCNIRQFPNLELNTELKELRLNGNKLTALPQSLYHMSGLQILDLGGNLLSSLDALAPLSQLPSLINLTLKGNPVCETEGYRDKVLALCPNLRILDNVRFDPKFLERREKRKDVLEMKARLKKKKLMLQQKEKDAKEGDESKQEKPVKGKDSGELKQKAEHQKSESAKANVRSNNKNKDGTSIEKKKKSWQQLKRPGSTAQGHSKDAREKVRSAPLQKQKPHQHEDSQKLKPANNSNKRKTPFKQSVPKKVKVSDL